ncbi:hypothetical protein B0H10DRAFT_1823111 [Mycena sp. CBHHK59/15]|nr:hypothetical protein B0H10DRAFT_1823111 [Mycena sp. CBHHK59/15]
MHAGPSFPSGSRAFRLPDRLRGVGAGDGYFAPNTILPVPSRAYVISLPRRKDRQEQMERLRTQLGLRWSYVAAEDSASQLVGRILSQVQSIREEELKMTERPLNTTIKLPFQWPKSRVPFELMESEFPTLPPPAPTALDASEPLTCASEDFTLLPYSPSVPEYKILTATRVACWQSHLSVIHRVSAHMPHRHGEAALVLEDDVDMELDIRERLLSVWSLLPPDWDIVFLGHCWSNESYHPALESSNHTEQTLPSAPPFYLTRLHPSRAPLCTHAYALSPTGARRLHFHLTYRPFAYSRAIDHALAWLVKSNRLKSFSVVPSVVVQRKILDSDVTEGKGSPWKDGLVKGVLGSGAPDSIPV